MPLESALYYSDGITGSNNKKGRADSSVVIEFDHRVYSPVDTQRGSVSGARVHDALVVVKEVDKATPLLYQAACSGKTLPEFKIEWYRISPTGQEEPYFQHTLKNVKVASVEIMLPNTKDPAKEKQTHLEKLELLYEEITWTFLDGQIEHVDAWKAPGS